MTECQHEAKPFTLRGITAEYWCEGCENFIFLEWYTGPMDEAPVAEEDKEDD